jgi:outer membrane protein assembly factor BamB
MPIAVTTRAYDNARTGANTQESVLTASNVATRGVRRLFSLQIPGDKRGVEAQPLVVPGVTLASGQTHDVIYLATMANQVLAFDFSNGTPLWQRTLGRPVDPGSKLNGNSIDGWNINDHWGVLSTPVIDLESQTMYCVAWVSPDGAASNGQHICYALRIRDGSDAQPPVNLEGATYNPGHGLPPQQFKSAERKQRASLLLTSVGGVKTVFIAFGTILESSTTARGWVIACSTSPFRISGTWTSTARGHGGGIWQAGAGLVADAAGFIYAMTGNGNFDAVTDLSESFIKLQYTPPTGSANSGSITAVDWWTPYTDRQRVGASPAREASETDERPRPANFRPYTARAPEAMDGWDDMDLGSGGPIVIDSQGVVVGAGKDGVLYVVNQNQMGKTQPTDLQNPAANYAKLKSPPLFFTYFPPNLNPAPHDIRTLNVFYANRTHHQHGNPLFWNSPDLGPMLFCWGENGNLRAWNINHGAVTFLANGAEQASAQSPVPYGGMPGSMMTLSANGNQPHTGVVWALIPYLDANKQVSPGRLLAYDATQFGTYADGSRQLRVLWDSARWNIAFTYKKFNPPVVANGRLLVPTYNATVDVYG